MKSFDVVITYLDDSEERILGATEERIHNGVLFLTKRRNSYGPESDHLGSWPLTSIKKWRKENHW